MAEKKQELYESSMLYRIRHSTAHIMAQAVLEKFPTAKIAIGPAIEEGFYYDFDLPRPLTPEDLTGIEKRMREIIKSDTRFVRRVLSADEAKVLFHDQPYKIELIEGLEKGTIDEDGNPLDGETGNLDLYACIFYRPLPRTSCGFFTPDQPGRGEIDVCSWCVLARG